MKSLFIVMLLVYFTSAKAQDRFEGSRIERKLKTGKTQVFDDSYMVVKRGVKKTQPPATVEKEVKKNTVKLFVGHGPNGLTRSGQRVDLDKEGLLGIGYQRHLNDTFSIEFIGTTTETFLLGGGYSF